MLVDCGLFQGARKLENQNRLPRRSGHHELDAVVLTHAHLDHTGRIPLLMRFGYSAPVPIDLADLVLLDVAHLQSEDARRENRRRREFWPMKIGRLRAVEAGHTQGSG